MEQLWMLADNLNLDGSPTGWNNQLRLVSAIPRSLVLEWLLGLRTKHLLAINGNELFHQVGFCPITLGIQVLLITRLAGVSNSDKKLRFDKWPV